MIKASSSVFALGPKVLFKEVRSNNQLEYIVLNRESEKKYILHGWAYMVFEMILSNDLLDVNTVCTQIIKQNICTENIDVTRRVSRILSDLYLKGVIHECDYASKKKFELQNNVYLSKSDNYYITNFQYGTKDKISFDTYTKLSSGLIEELSDDDQFLLYKHNYLGIKNQLMDFETFDDTDAKKNVYIILSYACNFKCTYCFEMDKENKDLKKMSEDTFSDVLSYLDHEVSVEDAIITFYGGEPLLQENEERIRMILERFRNHENIKYRIITNGLNAGAFSGWFIDYHDQIHEFVITIDGLQAVHDQRRILSDGSATFTSIVESVAKLIDLGFFVTVRVNIERSNYDSQIELAKYLDKLFSDTKEQMRLSYHLVEAKCDVNDIPLNTVLLFQLVESLKKVTEIPISCAHPAISFIERYSEPYYIQEYLIPFCGLRKNRVIDFDGIVYSCNEAMGLENFSIGNIESVGNISSEGVYNLSRKCMGCEFYLLCLGGCSLKNEMHTRKGTLNCKKEEIKSYIDSYLHQNLNKASVLV